MTSTAPLLEVDWPDAPATHEFAAQGYLVLPGLLPPDVVAAVLADFDEYVASQAERPLNPPAFKALGDPVAMQLLRESAQGARLFGAQGVVDTIGHGLHRLPGSAVQRLCQDPRLLRFLCALNLPAPAVAMTKGVMKPPRSGAKVPPHSDDQYIWTDPPSGITLWFSLDDAFAENGSVECLPGSHLRYAQGDCFCAAEDGRAVWSRCAARAGGGDPFPLKKQVVDALPWVRCDAPSGTCIAMDFALMHRSAANTSAFPRRALTIHLVSGDAAFASANWIPPEALLRL
jgi:ectoine hydroxylase-related dioxygenase (phytanoyl-CoA dioxygenase family)